MIFYIHLLQKYNKLVHLDTNHFFCFVLVDQQLMIIAYIINQFIYFQCFIINYYDPNFITRSSPCHTHPRPIRYKLPSTQALWPAKHLKPSRLTLQLQSLRSTSFWWPNKATTFPSKHPPFWSTAPMPLTPRILRLIKSFTFTKTTRAPSWLCPTSLEKNPSRPSSDSDRELKDQNSSINLLTSLPSQYRFKLMLKNITSLNGQKE